MGEGFIVRKGGVVSETTAAPTITEVSVTTNSITFTVTNNDIDEAIVYYDLDPVVDFSVDSVKLNDGDTSSNIIINDLDDDEEYIVYAIASAFGKQYSEQTSLAITTDEIIPAPEFELLFDSTGTVTFPQTQVDITGLNISSNDELRMVYTFKGDNSSTSGIYSIEVNDITSNYQSQRLSGVSSTLSAQRTSTGQFAVARSNRKTAGTMDIKVSENSRFVAQSQSFFGIGAENTNTESNSHNIANLSTVTSITKLSILCNRTNGIAANSRIRLYKVNIGEA
jgi:hypothetical protein